MDTSGTVLVPGRLREGEKEKEEKTGETREKERSGMKGEGREEGRTYV